MVIPQARVIDVPTLVPAIASAVVLLRLRWNSTWLVLAGGAIGVTATYLPW
jgi:hypothetical protein